MFDTIVNVYRTPPSNASGAPNTLILSGVVVDVQERGSDTTTRPPFGSFVSSGQLEASYALLLASYTPMPDIRENDILIDQATIDPFNNNEGTKYRVRRVTTIDGTLYCERIKTASTS